MLKQLLTVSLFVAVLGHDADFSEFSGTTTPRPGIPYVDYFDCSTTTLDHNKHPWDCTRFIQCDASNNAFDMPCAPCIDGPLCPGGGYLHFDGVPIGGNVPSCIWPADSTCIPGTNETSTEPPTRPPTTQPPTTQPPTTQPPTTQPPTTRPPTTQPPTTRPPTTQPPTTQPPTTQPPTTRPPTTQPPTTQPPTTQPPTTQTPPVGDLCNAENCTVDGDCHEYRFCERIPSSDDKGPIYDRGIVKSDSCGEKWYNPEASAGHQVATCSVWGELSQTTRDRYEKECIPTPCKLEGACQTNYKEIWTADSGKPSPDNRTCNPGTVLDDVIRRCLPCSQARRLGAGNVPESCTGQGDC